VIGESLTEARSTNPFPTLEGYKNANLATFRKSGEAVTTPVWYAVLDGKLYVRTGAGSGKVKRIRNNPRVRLAPATVRGKRIGPESEARARILGPGEEGLVEKVMKRLRQKYKTMPIVDLFVGREEHAILEIELAEA
jgi:PPOX class probable F420-dependent enzyme